MTKKIASDTVIEGTLAVEGALDEDILISGNIINGVDDQFGIEIAAVGADIPNRFKIVNNIITLKGDLGGQTGISAKGIKHIEISGNIVKYAGTATAWQIGIYSQSTSASTGPLIIKNNYVSGFWRAIGVDAFSTNVFLKVLIADNILDGEASSSAPGSLNYGIVTDSQTVEWATVYPDLTVEGNKASSAFYALMDLKSAPNKKAFFNATPVVRPTGVAVDAPGIHAALVSLGLITA